MLTVIPPENLSKPGDLEELVKGWKASLDLQARAGELSQNTVSTYGRGADKFMGWCQAVGIQAVTAETLRVWKAALLGEGKKPAAVNAWFAGVRSLLAWAVEQKRLPYNPAASVKGAKRQGTTRRHGREALTDLEIRRVLQLPDRKTAQGARDVAILSLMAYTAARSIEVLRADLVDLRTDNGKLVLMVTGKGHVEADSVIVISNQNAAIAIYDWLAVRGDKPGPLFTSLSDRSKGKRLSSSALRHLVMGYYHQAGVHGNKTTHSLRHTAITKAIVKGAPLQKVQSMARHQSLETTMVYFHEIDRLVNPAEDFVNYGE